MSSKIAYPTEEQEHIKLALYLNYRFGPFAWYHPANERMAKPQYYRKLAAKGTTSGFPDFLIFDCKKAKGMAIELKRCKEAHPKISDAQRQWLNYLSKHGWITCIAYGAEDAIAHINQHYGPINNEQSYLFRDEQDDDFTEPNGV